MRCDAGYSAQALRRRDNHRKLAGAKPKHLRAYNDIWDCWLAMRANSTSCPEALQKGQQVASPSGEDGGALRSGGFASRPSLAHVLLEPRADMIFTSR